MSSGADLYRLQSLDSESDAKQRRLAEVEAAIGESDELKQARQALQDAQARAQKQKLQQRNLELEIQGLADKIAQSEQRLYSGEVKNPKALTELQNEIQSLKRRRQKLEDTLLEVMIERDETDAACAGAQRRLETLESVWAAEQARLKAEREDLQARLAALKQSRAELLPSIPAVHLSAYQNLRRRKGGTVVVQLVSEACGGCGVAISPSLKWQLRQEGLVHCSNCERIVVQG